MSIDIAELLSTLGGQVADKAEENIKAAGEKLTPRDREIVERAGKRKVELLIAGVMGQDTTADELQINETLAFIAGKGARIAKEVVKKTFLEVVTIAGKTVLKLAFGAILPI